MNTINANISQHVVAKLLTAVAEEETMKVPVGFLKGQLDIFISRLQLKNDEVRIPLQGKITGKREMVLADIQEKDGILWFTPKSEGGAFDRVVNTGLKVAIKMMHKKLHEKVVKNRTRRAKRRNMTRKGSRPISNAQRASTPTSTASTPAPETPLDEGAMRFAKEEVHVEGKRIGVGIASLLADWPWLEITEIRVDNEVKISLTTKRQPDQSVQPGSNMSAKLEITSSFLQSILSDPRIIPDKPIEGTPLGDILIEGGKIRIEGSHILVPIKVGTDDFCLKVAITDGKISADLMDT